MQKFDCKTFEFCLNSLDWNCQQQNKINFLYCLFKNIFWITIKFFNTATWWFRAARNNFFFFNCYVWTITHSLSLSKTKKSFNILSFIPFFKYIRMLSPFLQIFLSWWMKLKFGKWKFELSLKSLFVDNVSATQKYVKRIWTD